MAAALIPASIGFRSHSGWAATVCLTAPAISPLVIERSRLLLTSGSLPCEPYHRAKGFSTERSEQIVLSAADEARSLAAEAVVDLRTMLESRGYELLACGIALGAGRPGFTLSQALSNHAGMHNAEGWLFREALMQACESCGLPAIGVPESGLFAELAGALGLPQADSERRVREMGSALGPPWATDQRFATAAAWLALFKIR